MFVVSCSSYEIYKIKYICCMLIIMSQTTVHKLLWNKIFSFFPEAGQLTPDRNTNLSCLLLPELFLTSNLQSRCLLFDYITICLLYLFCSPVLCLPTGNSPAIAVRFCPQLFSLRPKSASHTQLFRLVYIWISVGCTCLHVAYGLQLLGV